MIISFFQTRNLKKNEGDINLNEETFNFVWRLKKVFLMVINHTLEAFRF